MSATPLPPGEPAPADELRDEVAQLHEAEGRIVAELAALRADVAALRAGSGERV